MRKRRLNGVDTVSEQIWAMNPCTKRCRDRDQQGGDAMREKHLKVANESESVTTNEESDDREMRVRKRI